MITTATASGSAVTARTRRSSGSPRSRARDGDEADRSAQDDRPRRFRLEPRNIGDDNAGLIDEAQLERKDLSPERRSERGPAKELRNDDGDEAPFSPRETPDVLEDGIEGPVLSGNDLELGSPPGPFQALVGHVFDACGTLVTGTGEHLVDALTGDAERTGKLGLVGACLVRVEQGTPKVAPRPVESLKRIERLLVGAEHGLDFGVVCHVRIVATQGHLAPVTQVLLALATRTGYRL
jgi:hypothetical protein